MPSMTPDIALAQLLGVETDLSSALGREHNEAHLQAILSRFDLIGLALSQNSEKKRSDAKLWTQVAFSVQRIQTIATSFAEQEQRLSRQRRDVTGTLKLLLQERNRDVAADPSSDEGLHGQVTCSTPSHRQANATHTASDRSEQSLNAVVMRRWMLEHIEHPFPSTQDKEDIAEETNRGPASARGQLRPEQATLWFINTRRRSGWTTWARRFANCDKTRLRAIVAAIHARNLSCSESKMKEEDVADSLEELVEAYDAKDQGLSKTELAKLCRTEFLKVIDWIEQGSKERVGDWMDKVVSEAKATLKRKKQDRRAARKLLAQRRRGRTAAAAAIRDLEIEESEDELAEEQLAAKARPGLRPIRRMPQQRNVSGASSSSSCLSSAVSGRLYPSGSSSSAATSFDSTYELGVSSRGYVVDHKTESAGRYFQQLQVSDDQSSGEVCSPSPKGGVSRLPPLAPQQQHRADQAHTAYETQQVSLAHLQPQTSSSWPAPTGAETVRYDQKCDDSHKFFMPSVTAAAALGNNWGMPVSTSVVDQSMTGQSDEAVNYGGWLAWSGQMMSGEA